MYVNDATITLFYLLTKLSSKQQKNNNIIFQYRIIMKFVKPHCSFELFYL